MKRPALAIITLAFSVASVLQLVNFPQTPVRAANTSNFNPSLIISDDIFIQQNTMSASQIQDFLEAKNSVCLKDFNTLGLYDADDDGLGDEPYGKGNGTKVKASTLIWQAAQLYDINPRVILVTLQKEQSLITRQTCPSSVYKEALGYGCPSTCDSNAHGFTRQIDYGTWHFKGFFHDTYPVPPTVPTQSKYISYNPDSRCGGRSIAIANRATAALYSYTPHQPNQYALNGGTVASYPNCGAFGNLNFWRFFTDWFGSTYSLKFTSMNTPRFMEVKQTTNKQYPGSEYSTGVDLEVGRQIFFTSKTTVNGVTYLRTEQDTKAGALKGVPLSDLQEVTVEYVPLDNPRWMEISSDIRKIDPRTKKPVSGVISEGQKVYVPTKAVVGGITWLRSQYDTDNDRQTGIPVSSMAGTSVSYEPLSTPRWMKTSKDTRVYDLKAGISVGEIIPAGTNLFAAQKVSSGKSWYAKKDPTADGVFTGVPLSSIAEVRPTYSALSTPRWMKIKTNTHKQSPITLQIIGAVLEQGEIVYVSSTFSIGGKTYIRTKYNSDRGDNRAIPALDLEEVSLTWQPLNSPRTAKLTKDTYAVDPVTEKRIGSIIKKGTVFFFPSKTSIAGKEYLRTQYSHDNEKRKGILRSALSL